jgi:hypothetical protein
MGVAARPPPSAPTLARLQCQSPGLIASQPAYEVLIPHGIWGCIFKASDCALLKLRYQAQD